MARRRSGRYSSDSLANASFNSGRHRHNSSSPYRNQTKQKTGFLATVLIIAIATIVTSLIMHYWALAVVIFVCAVVPVLLLLLLRRIAIISIRRLFRTRSRSSENQTKIRVSVPSSIQQQVRARARGRCERPHCSYGGGLHIHHIDENPSNNSPYNLVLVCPNCHSRIHHGEFSYDAQRSWIAA